MAEDFQRENNRGTPGAGIHQSYELSAGATQHDIDPEKLEGGEATIAKSHWCRILPIFNEHAAYNLQRHKYSGSDEGILYKWFYNPVATKLVSYLPDWVAPNTLTLIGFIHTIVPLVTLFTIADFDLLGEVPRWFFFFQAWCYFAYRMLDEMDGKQARRTQNSSPLGLIFDHGCDAFSTGLQALTALRTLQCGNNFLAYATVVMAMAAFHFTTLEEYYVGTLKLPVCNAVSDGSLPIIALYIVTGILGNGIWVTGICDGTWLNIEGITELTLGQVLVSVMCVMSLFIIIGNFVKIIRSKNNPHDTQAEDVDLLSLLIQTLGFWCWTAIWFAVAFVGNEPIHVDPIQVDKETSENFEALGDYGQKYFMTYSLLYIFVIVHNTIRIQLCHTSLMKYHPFSKIYLFSIFALLITAIAAAATDGQANVRMSILIITCLTALLQWLFLIVVAKEITSILGISVFLTKQTVERRKNKKLGQSGRLSIDCEETLSRESMNQSGVHSPNQPTTALLGGAQRPGNSLEHSQTSF